MTGGGEGGEREEKDEEKEELTHTLKIQAHDLASPHGLGWKLEYSKENRLFVVHACQGKITQTIGHMKAGVYLLEPEEALYLARQGRAQLSASQSNDEILALLLEEQALSLNRFEAYSVLKDLGYILRTINQDLYLLNAPDQTFRKSNPPPPLGTLTLVHADDYLEGGLPPPIDSMAHLLAVHDEGGGHLFLQAHWSDPHPSNYQSHVQK